MSSDSKDRGPGLLIIKLPAEIRLLIYDFILADYRALIDAHQDRFRAGQGRVCDYIDLTTYDGAVAVPQDSKSRQGIPLFVLNHQTHEEASQAFYSQGVFEICMKGEHTGRYKATISTCFLNKTFEAEVDVAEADWLPLVLRRAHHLRLRLRVVNDHAHLCEVQTLLYVILARMGTEHALKSLHISIEVEAPRRSQGPIPRHTSLSQVVDVLTAPVTNICTGDLDQSTFNFEITGEEGQPLTELAERIKTSIYDRKQHIKYLAFIRYFTTFIETWDAVYPNGYPSVRVQRKTNEHNSARIHGDLSLLQRSAKELIDYLQDPSPLWCDEEIARKVQENLGRLTDALAHVFESAGEVMGPTDGAADVTEGHASRSPFDEASLFGEDWESAFM